MKKISVVLAAILGVGWIGCGGGSSSTSTGSTSVSGLSLPSEMSLVQAQEVTAGSISATKGFHALAKAVPTSGAYTTDPLNVYVFDDSMESLNVINEILCSVDQTLYDGLVNQGNYIALIDNTKCNKGDSKASDQGNQSSGADSEDLETWVVNSSRANDTAPHVVSAWIEERAEGDFDVDKEIQAKMTITEGVSDSNPYGKFHINFKMVATDGSGTELAKGYLETVDRTDGKLEFQFAMEGTEGFNVEEASHVVTADADRLQ